MIEDIDVSKDEAEKYQQSLIRASVCRYEASSRLKYRSVFSFQATIALSMGLIFIPLMQATNLKLALSNEVLNMLQLFIAVAVLIFSVINSQSRYGIRAVHLNACGDEIKALARALSARLSILPDGAKIKISDIQANYMSIKVDVENHSRTDYHFACMKEVDLSSLNFIGWVSYIALLVTARLKYIAPYLVPTLVVGFELCLILDILGVTKLFTPLFNSLKP